VLLTLLLTVALMAIFVGAILPQITFEIKRDREEEMIHRGVQYSRAIRLYYKKFGRYPTRIEDLESANNLRFLRKRYKDPITGQDFKLLHFGEVKMSSSIGLAGAGIPGANGVGGQTGLNGPGQQSAFGSGSSAFGGNNTLGGNNSFGNNNGPGNSRFGTSDPSQPLGGDPTQSGSSSNGTSTQNPGSTNTDSTNTGSTPSGNTQANSGQPGSTDSNGAGGDKLAGKTFGGGPVVGVASASKKDTIREFNHKKKYNDWQFIYDPATDRGGLLMTPNQPQLQQGFGQQGVQNGTGNGNNGSFGGTIGAPPPGMLNDPGLNQNSQPNPPPQ